MDITPEILKTLQGHIRQSGGFDRFSKVYDIDRQTAYKIQVGTIQKLRDKTYQKIKGLLVPAEASPLQNNHSDDSILTACINELKRLDKAKQIEALKLIVDLQQGK